MQSPSEPPKRAVGNGTAGAREAVQRWRLVVSRAQLPSDRQQRDLLADWESALVASGLPVAGLDGSRPKPRFAIAAPLAAGVPSEAELVDIWLVERLPRWRVREALEALLPTGHALVDLYNVWLGEPALPGQVAASIYRTSLARPVDTARLAAAADGLLAAESLPRERRKGEATVQYDLRPFLAGIEVVAGPEGRATLRLTLRHDPARGIGRPEEVLAALGESMGILLEAEDLVREGLVLTEPAPPEPTAQRVPRRGPAPRPPRAGRPAAGGLPGVDAAR